MGVAATTRPDGMLSVKSRLPAATVFAELSIVNVRVDVPPALMVLGEKAFVNVGGGAICNESVAGGNHFSGSSSSKRQ